MRTRTRVGRPVPPLTLTRGERKTLERWAGQSTTAARALAQRARVILRCAAGQTNTRAARALRLTKQTVGKWRRRFLANRLVGLLDDSRPGAPRSISDAKVDAVVRLTLASTPPDAAHWSTRAMAARCGLSQTTVSRIWRAFGLQPLRAKKTVKPRPDLRFVQSVRDVVGLYLDPSKRALALCVDGRAQMPARYRTRPLRPMRPGQPERRTPLHARDGRASLFATLDALSGKTTGHRRRPRAVDLRRFLDRVEATVPTDVEIHLVLDSNVTQEAPVIRRWLAKHPRYHLHTTPISSSWLHVVERWFAQLSQKQPKPFVWTPTADKIAARAQRRVGGSRAHETGDHAAAPRASGPGVSRAGSQIAT